MLLEGKAVLITGASRGIGRATAIACAAQGADVAINVFADPDGTAEATDAVRALGRRGVVFEGDVADPDNAPAFIQAAVDGLGKVDVFVSNAGICPFHAFLDMPRETYDRTVAVNMTGAYFMVQAAANRMVEQGRGGAIVAISSVHGPVGGGVQDPHTPAQGRGYSPKEA